MYAVIESGGKQYRVELGNEIEVDRLDVEPGQTIRLERVLLVADGDEATIGRPLVEGALVNADVLRQDRGEKLVVFKYKPKARTRVKKGHRADLTVLRIAEIALNGKSAAKEAAAVAAEQKAAREAAEKAAAEKAAADRALAAKLAPEPKGRPPRRPRQGDSDRKGARKPPRRRRGSGTRHPPSGPRRAAPHLAHPGRRGQDQGGRRPRPPSRRSKARAPRRGPAEQDRPRRTRARRPAATEAADAPRHSTKKDE